ncbi:MAG: hypothetical protein GC164_02265 [Phycisphaera sp.]|nr:hypothetical protein [Phycisphaera sp.]
MTRTVELPEQGYEAMSAGTGDLISLPRDTQPQPDAVAQGSWRYRLGWCLAGVLVLGAWLPSLWAMYRDWGYPIWPSPAFEDAVRFGRLSLHYNTLPFLAVLCVWVAWARYRDVGVPVMRRPWSTTGGYALLLGALLLQALSLRAVVLSVSGIALVGTVTGLLLVIGGGRLLWAYRWPVISLFILVPRPHVWANPFVDGFNFWMCAKASRIVEAFTGWVTIQDDRWVLISTSGHSQGIVKWSVNELSAGHEWLILLASLAWLVAISSRATRLRKWLTVPVVVAVVLGGSFLRMVALIVLRGQGWANDAQSVGTAVAVTVVGIVTVALLNRRAGGVRRTGHVYCDVDHRSHVPMPALAMLGIAAISGPFVLANANERSTTNFTRTALPTTLEVWGQTLSSHDITLDERAHQLIRSDDLLMRVYDSELTDATGTVFLAHSNSFRNGVHSPEACLEHAILERDEIVLDVPGVGRVPMKVLITGKSQYEWLHLYGYYTRWGFTDSYPWQQVSALTRGVCLGDSEGGQVRVSIPVRNLNIETARSRASELAVAVVSSLNRSLHEGTTYPPNPEPDRP